jgi:hypothetical protein
MQYFLPTGSISTWAPLCIGSTIKLGGRHPIGEDNTRTLRRASRGGTVIGGRERANSAKHIDVCKRFVHEVVQNSKTRLIQVDRPEQLTDVSNTIHRFSAFWPQRTGDAGCWQLAPALSTSGTSGRTWRLRSVESLLLRFVSRFCPSEGRLPATAEPKPSNILNLSVRVTGARLRDSEDASVRVFRG